MKRYIGILLLLTLVLNHGLAQQADSLMKLVLEHNLELQVAREATRTAILRAGTGNAPPDPEVEFGYLFGDPAVIGNKLNIVVKQEVDFPTSYVHRSRLREIRTSRSELEYVLVRQEVLSRARQLWIGQLHLNQLALLLGERLDRARAVLAHTADMLDAGEVGLLEYNQATLMLASVEGEYEEAMAAMAQQKMALREICGGRSPEISATRFPEPAVLQEDSLISAYSSGPAVLLHREQRAQRESEKKLAQSLHLPKFSAGYFSEAIPSEAFRGFTLGLSLPLWENTRQVKTATSALLQSEVALERFLMEQESELGQKLKAREQLLGRVWRLEKALNAANSLDLLETAMESGEISLAEYFYSSDFVYRNQQLLLGYKHDLLVLDAELMKIYY